MRLKPSRDSLQKILVPVAGVFIGLVVGALVVVNKDRSLFLVIGRLFYNAVGTWGNLTSSLVFTIPLGFTGLAVAFSYSAGIFNVGAEGQLQLGALLTGLVATSSAFGSSWTHIPLALLAGAVIGAFWALIPGLLKAYKGFNEIVVTMLMNYIAILVVNFLLEGPMKAPGAFYPQTRPFAQTAWLRNLVPGSDLHYGFFIVLVFFLLIWFVLYKTPLGFKIRAVGFNPEGSRYAGIRVKRIMVTAMLVSGALAGLGGSVEVMGVYRRVTEGFSPGYGFDAIAVALLANLNPIGIFFSAFFFGALRNAASGLQVDLGVPISFIHIVQALAILFVIATRGMPRQFEKIKRRLHNGG
jgi:simple sugar transport system permease protein